MKTIVEYKYGTTNYSVGDVVYLRREEGNPTCMAVAIENYNGSWLFKSLSKQSYYSTRNGLIPFGCKPYIFAKEVEVKEEQP